MSKINKPSVYVCTHVCAVTELTSHGTSFDLCTGGSCPTEEQYQDVTGFGGAGLSPSDLFLYSELELKGLVGIEPTLWLIHTSEIMFFVFSYSEIENLALTVKERAANSLQSVSRAASARGKRRSLHWSGLNHCGAYVFNLVSVPFPD